MKFLKRAVAGIILAVLLAGGITAAAISPVAITADETETADNSDKGKSSTLITVLTIAAVGGLAFLIFNAKGKGDPGEIMPDDTNGFNAESAPKYNSCVLGEGGFFDGKRFEIEETAVIGRQGGSCSICYPADTNGISGMHCQLRTVGSKLELIDLSSTYGTFVNGEKIEPNTPVLLDPGDRFTLANTNNTFLVC